ncbi:MAG TPA: thiamine-phosphate kinase [Planctomycetaceae bacterium]|nr:thiamine-phosphate kinase [Planctomycetaceae bacterium]
MSEPLPENEFALVERLRRRVSPRPWVALGIGDDAAALRLPASGDCLVTVDLLMEGTDFTFPPATAALAGRKSLAVNLSDIAAMAGRPLAAFVALALPRERGAAFAEEFLDGLIALADEFEVALAGGDTNIWSGPLVASVTVVGEPTGRGPVTRSGARPGDWIFVTGALGGSLAGRHLTFPPRVAEARRLHQAVELHAMIDLSDGLASDLRHILEASAVGAVLYEERIPISEAVLACRDGRTPLEHALGDGEDFELLFAVSPDNGRRLLDAPPVECGLSHIGEIRGEAGCDLVGADGSHRPLPRIGWEHRFTAP